MKLSDAEIYMAKEEACRLGVCTATYYIVNLIDEVEELRAKQADHEAETRRLREALSAMPVPSKCLSKLKGKD